jgi:hypothetical protein
MTGKIVVKATQQQQQHGGTGNGWKDPNRSKLSNEQNPTHLGAKLQTMPGGGMPVGMTMQLPHPNGSGNIMVPNADTIANMNGAPSPTVNPMMMKNSYMNGSGSSMSPPTIVQRPATFSGDSMNNNNNIQLNNSALQQQNQRQQQQQQMLMHNQRFPSLEQPTRKAVALNNMMQSQLMNQRAMMYAPPQPQQQLAGNSAVQPM